MNDMPKDLCIAMLILAACSLLFGVNGRIRNVSQANLTVYMIVEGFVPVALATLAVIVWYLGS